MKHWSSKLEALNACREAVVWASNQPDAATAWATCKRGDWMLWILGKQAGAPGSDARRPLVLAACECARLALPYVRAGELRPLHAIETAERWARGGADAPSLDMVRQAAYAADAAYAAFAADAADAADAAYAADAADAAYAAFAADAADAAYAAFAAYATFAAYAYADARSRVLAQCADIVRKHYPSAPDL